MSRWLSGAILALAVFLLVRPVEAATACPPPKPAAIKVMTSLPPPVLDNTLDRRALEAKASRDHPGSQPIGLYEAELKLDAETAYLFNQVGGEVCVVLNEVKLNLSFGNRRIYVQRDYPPGSCAYNAVLTHERKHQAVDENLVQEYLPRLIGNIETAVAQAKQTVSVPVGRHEEVMHRFGAIAGAAVDQGFKEMNAERNRREAAVDNRDEYARVARSCPGGLPGL